MILINIILNQYVIMARVVLVSPWSSIWKVNRVRYVFSPSFVVVDGLKLFDVAGTTQLVPLTCNHQSVLVKTDVQVFGRAGGNVVVVVRTTLPFLKCTNSLNSFSLLFKSFVV